MKTKKKLLSKKLKNKTLKYRKKYKRYSKKK